MTDLSFGPKGWLPEMMSDQSGKTHVITGATSGIGLQATRRLLSRGARVVMLNRSPEKSEATIAALKQEFGAQADVTAMHLDLASLASVKTAAQEVLARVPHIDALICNAAIAQVPNQVLTEDGFESMLGTNHYGHFALCGLLYPLLDASKARVVVVSSLGYNMGTKRIHFEDMNWNDGYHQNRTYCHSKLAQMMFAYELQDRLAAAGNSGIQTYVCHPGAARTSLIETSANLVSRLLFRVMAALPMVQSADQGAWPVLLCSTADGLEERALYGPTGTLEFKGPVGKGTLHPHAVDKPTMTKLWTLSEQQTGVSWGI